MATKIVVDSGFRWSYGNKYGKLDYILPLFTVTFEMKNIKRIIDISHEMNGDSQMDLAF